MKLSKLYTNKENFKNIGFNPGVNVIYAEVKTKISEKKNSHNLGKTLLSELIDIMLLKKLSPKNHFLFTTKNDKGEAVFSSYIFYLEILLNSGKYLTIKRSVSNNTKISFKLNEQRTSGFNPPNDWDEENVSIDRARKVLAEYLNFDFFRGKEDYDYRKSINYSIRQQGDYADIYRLTKFKGRDLYWKPFMFDLLGFDGNLLQDKYERDDEIDEISKFINNLKNEFSVKVEERDELVAQIQLKESQTKSAEQQIDKFNFYEQDKSLIKEGVEEVETKISELNTIAYNLEFDINRLKSSIKNKFSFDFRKVEKVFKEAELFFSDQLKKDYEDLIEFNQNMTLERNKLLRKTLKEKSSEFEGIRKELKQLNARKEELLSFLQESNVFKKFKEYQKGLVKLEGQLIQLQEKLKTIDTILEKEKDIKDIKQKLDETIEKIGDEYKHTDSNVIYKAIRDKFGAYYKTILNEDAYISWNINTANNVDFNQPKVISEGDIKRDTAQGDGFTYGKLFCVAFDLALLTAYNKESYYRFVYHDDVFANEDTGVKHRFLKLIRNLVEDYDLQYIFSIIKDDLPADDEDKPIKFDSSEVVLELSDKDPSETLFGFRF
ncbi:MAG: DUF2326 domain-containing protein [Bacteroidota bacterium]